MRVRRHPCGLDNLACYRVKLIEPYKGDAMGAVVHFVHAIAVVFAATLPISIFYLVGTQFERRS